MKKCPFCAEEIQDEAIKCKHCNSMLPVAPPADYDGSYPLPKNLRHCLECGYRGEMKTWLGNYSKPQFIALLGLFFWLLPGVVFIIWAWGKYRCPKCGTVGKSDIQ